LLQKKINQSTLKTINGYQIMPRTELDPRYIANRELIDGMENVLVICSTGAGYDMVDVAASTDAGIIVCNQSETNKEAVAEHVFGVMLGLSKKMFEANQNMHSIDRLGRKNLAGNDIFGKTLGIIGIGQIGSRTAEIAKAFRIKVIAYDPYIKAEEIKTRGATKVDWLTVLSTSDFISVHCPRTEETLNMFDAIAFKAMKPSAFFVTTARGGIHNEKDLAIALSLGRIAGAGLDVWWEEPTPITNPLLKFDNVVASPHMAGVTREAMVNMGVQAAHQWIEIFKGKVPTRLVNPEAWEKYSARFLDLLEFKPDPFE
jgi:D-3-phosphoglycerate dehydrogenase